MATYKKVQAASLWVDISCQNLSLLDPSANAWNTNWVGLWNITNSTGTVVLSGNLLKSTAVGVFQLRIGTASVTGWSTLPIGTYTITYQFRNSTVDYDQEDSDTLVITKQRYV